MKILLLLLLSVAAIQNANSDWQQISSYPSSTAHDMIILNGKFFVCSINNGVYRSTDSGISWEERNNNLTSADSKRVYDIDFINGRFIIASVDGIYVSTDEGGSWERKSSGMTIGPGANNVFAYSVFEDNGIIFSGIYNGIYRSTDNCETWNLSNVSMEHSDVDAFYKFHGELYAGRDAINPPALYKSTDTGLMWSTVNVWNNFPVSVFCFYSEADTLFVGTAVGMWYTTNNGLNWTNRNSGLSLDPYVSSIAKSGNAMIASLKFGGSGVFRSFNNGIQWEEITDNLPFLNEISKLLIYNNKVYAATSNKIWFRDLNEIITSVDPIGNSFPEKYSLYQNYPNPFNPNTIINYELRIKNYTKLEIFDINGKEVATLVDENQNAGRYSVKFDGSNLSSGIYFYKLSAGNYNETKRMLLLK